MEEVAVHASNAESANGDGSPGSGNGSAELARAVAEIHLGSSQREILRALLDTSARYAERVALFVVKGSQARGWQARGFAQNDALKDFSLDGSATAIGRVLAERTSTSASIAEMDAQFCKEFGEPISGEARVVPLILKDKIAALIYADGGTAAGGRLDAGSLDLLVLSTGSWLEVNSLRKQAQKESLVARGESHGASSKPEVYAAPMRSALGATDPFAAHAPAHHMERAQAAAAGAEAKTHLSAVAATATEETAQSIQMPYAAGEVEAAFAEPLPEPLPDPPPQPLAILEALPPALSPEDQEVHRKAQRFARLLVDEIKLYNQTKVTEGRKNKDLYDRLKDAVDKSRATYQKRYGTTVAASANYFQHEIIRSLAEDDVSIMGANFRQ
jgi:hypothetical protein